jgi:DNA-directed RNA polymerase specialized sigma24 family protein
MEQRGGASHSHRATELLRAWGAGDAAAFEQLIPLVHAELRRLARRYMGHERPGHTLQPTALVNEAYLRLWTSTRCAGRIARTSWRWRPG